MLDEGNFPDETLRELFFYHPPSTEQRIRYEALRSAALEFAQVLRDLVPASADRTAAIRKLREAVMTANAAIALEDLRR